MFYVRTADRLQRTAAWIEALDGGLDHLRAVIVDDSLGICADLDAAMARHVASYTDEWRAVLDDPEKLRRFVSFVNAAADAGPVDLLRSSSGTSRCRPAPCPLGIPEVRTMTAVTGRRRPVDGRVPARRPASGARRGRPDRSTVQVAVFRLHDDARASDRQPRPVMRARTCCPAGIVGTRGGPPRGRVADAQAGVRPRHRGLCLDADGRGVPVFPVRVRDGVVEVGSP